MILFSRLKKFDFARLYPLFFTIIFIVIIFQYSFHTLEAIFYDFRIRYDFGTSFHDNIVIVTLDEESDEFLGESYPYAYASNTRMLKKLIVDKPKIINYFGSLLEPDLEEESYNLNKFRKIINSYTSDGGIFRFGTEIDTWGEQKLPRGLEDIGSSLAIINIDNSAFARDDVSRKALINISGESSLHLWTANKFREFKGEPKLTLKDISGSFYMREADATFSYFRYYTSPLVKNGLLKKIPFHRVLVGNYPKGFFKDKIVLIGPNYISNSSNFVLTPYSKQEYSASKLAVHAQIIQSLVQNKTIVKVPKLISYILAILISIFLPVVISKTKPTNGLMITVAVIICIFVFSHLFFSLFGLWIQISHLILTVFIIYYIWVPYRAISEYQRRFAIQEETKLLKKVENLKQNFISLMSHDLKTPVAKIAGQADVMLQITDDTKAMRTGLFSIIDSTKELNKFITSILDLTKIESQNLSLNMVSKDINPIIENIVEKLKYEAEQKKVLVNLNLSPLYPIHIDITLVMRIISNLVENAIKYSGEGSQVSIKTWDDAKWVYIEISDNGVGIDKEDMEHIFDKFYRVKNDASHSIKGTGLGLYLVKYFVELHGGSIRAESELGSGTTFKLTFKNE